ncbi:hypothetical protein ACFX13_013939 [Malus domestica]
MDSNGEYETEAETMALRRARSSIVESSDSEPEGRPQARPATATDPPPKAQCLSQATSEGLGTSPIPWPQKVAAA